VTTIKLKKPHVLTLTSFYPSSGDEVSGCFVAETLEQLTALGTESSLIAVDSIYHARKKSSGKFPAEWIRYPQLPGNFGLSSAGKFLGSALLNRVRQLHHRYPISVIHAHAALPCGHAAAFLSRHLGIPFVVTIHGLDVFNNCFEDGVAAGWRRKSSQYVYRSAHTVICISKKIERLLHDEMDSGVRTEVIYNGTDIGRFSPDSSIESSATEGAPTILMVGNLLAGKGQELVLRAIGKLVSLFPNLQCRIIGEGSDQGRFEKFAKELGIGNRVHFFGRRSRTDVAEAMRRCTVFALPSRYEGLGCVYLEAMATGKPVIACRGQGIDEIIQHGSNGWLIPVDNLEELVQGLQLLLGDPTLRLQMGNAARKTIVEGFTMLGQAEKLLRIYEEAAR
jgi:teichuronic acid biosynthesis glycosyltransferase TuaC